MAEAADLSGQLGSLRYEFGYNFGSERPQIKGRIHPRIY